MIEIVQGNIIDQPTEALVNTVNCVGVMGRGIALSFKKAFPENFHEYQAACKNKQVVPGKMFVYIAGDIFERKYIINFPTKRHWKGKSRLEDIKEGLVDLVKVVKEYGITSITVPPLGCGLGGLDWKDVRPLIEAAFKELPDVMVKVIEPNGKFDVKQSENTEVKNTKLTPGRASLLVLMGRYLEAMMDTSVTLLELHKLMYFLQEAGEPLRLQYEKALYGPYAKNLRHVLDVMNNIYVSGFDDREDNPQKEIHLLEDAYVKADDFLNDKKPTVDNIKKTTSLIAGFETPFGMELLSSVHWVCTRDNATDRDDVINKIHGWNKRKEMFTEKHIDTAWRHLKDCGWG